jgi:tetratricopeptide (TPR) repeat protein
MKVKHPFHKHFVAALFPIFFGCTPLQAQTVELDRLFSELATAQGPAALRLERMIWREWSKSGSAAMDLLLQRGRDAMSAGETEAAIEHFTALIDHAPEFAEGWNARATAYFQAGLYGPSVADIAQTLRLNPRHFGALAGFGRILEETDKPEEALKVYRSALAIHPQLQGVKSAVERLEAKASGQEL